jgi:hypothetical protein
MRKRSNIQGKRTDNTIRIPKARSMSLKANSIQKSVISVPVLMADTLALARNSVGAGSLTSLSSIASLKGAVKTMVGDFNDQPPTICAS